MGTFVCAECTIGFNGNDYGRVDMVSIDTKSIVRCYEVKSCVSDFRSKSKWTFVGHYNYFVMPSETYEIVKEEIPKHIGVYVDGTCIKKPKKQIVTDNIMNIIQMSMIRSLSRDADKLHKLDNPRVIEQYETKITRLQNENYRLRKDRWKQV